MAPAIVVVTYSRVNSLKRLLKSISQSIFDELVTLYISIDHGEYSQEIYAIANKFNWTYGDKVIIKHDRNLGLKKHILGVGELTKNHEFIIVLEDDLFVSPHFFKFSRAAFDYYKSTESVFGISLYSPKINETTLGPFYPIKKSDIFFLQLPCSWGQVWYRESWDRFSEWLNINDDTESLYNKISLPNNIKRWSSKSWKKLQLVYMIENELFYVYPCESYTTNYGETGEHVMSTSFFQVQTVEFFRMPIFDPFSSDSVVYDSWCELVHIDSEYIPDGIVFDIDINGTKKIFTSDYVLTTKKSSQPIICFGDNLFPLEYNVIKGNVSSYGRIVLSHKGHLKRSFSSRLGYYFRMFNIKKSMSMIARLF